MGSFSTRVHAWNDHAPDPISPLLVGSPASACAARAAARKEPTKWWVYATVFGAVAAGALVIYAHDRSSEPSTSRCTPVKAALSCCLLWAAPARAD